MVTMDRELSPITLAADAASQAQTIDQIHAQAVCMCAPVRRLTNRLYTGAHTAEVLLTSRKTTVLLLAVLRANLPCRMVKEQAAHAQQQQQQQQQQQHCMPVDNARCSPIEERLLLLAVLWVRLIKLVRTERAYVGLDATCAQADDRQRRKQHSELHVIA